MEELHGDPRSGPIEAGPSAMEVENGLGDGVRGSGVYGDAAFMGLKCEESIGFQLVETGPVVASVSNMNVVSDEDTNGCADDDNFLRDALSLRSSPEGCLTESAVHERVPSVESVVVDSATLSSPATVSDDAGSDIIDISDMELDKSGFLKKPRFADRNEIDIWVDDCVHPVQLDTAAYCSLVDQQLCSQTGKCSFRTTLATVVLPTISAVSVRQPHRPRFGDTNELDIDGFEAPSLSAAPSPVPELDENRSVTPSHPSKISTEGEVSKTATTPEEFHCTLCNVRAQSSVVWQAHIAGKRHLKKVKAAEGESSSTPAEVKATVLDKLQEREENDEENKATKREIAPRMYQLEVLEAAVKCNSLAFLETGSGKTLIAVMLIKIRLSLIRKRQQERQARLAAAAAAAEALSGTGDQSDMAVETTNSGATPVISALIEHIPPKSLIAFVAPTKLLLEQQRRYIAGNCECKIQSFTGGEMNLRNVTRAQWVREITSIEIMMLTPEVFRSILQQHLIPVASFDLVIFDECHHCVRKSPMAQCCLTIQQEPAKNRPRIFGMTASPISGKKGSISKKLTDLEGILDCKLIKPKSEVAVHELNTLVPKPTLSILPYPNDNAMDSLLTIKAIETFYDDNGESEQEVNISVEKLFSCFGSHASMDTTGIIMPLNSVHVMLHGYQRIRYAMYLWNIKILLRDLGVAAADLPQLQGLNLDCFDNGQQSNTKEKPTDVETDRINDTSSNRNKKRKQHQDRSSRADDVDEHGKRKYRYRFRESVSSTSKRKHDDITGAEDDTSAAAAEAQAVNEEPPNVCCPDSGCSIEFEDEFALHRRQIRQKQKKSVNELMIAYGQIICIYKDCGLLCAIEALKVAVRPSQSKLDEIGDCDTFAAIDLTMCKNMTIDLSRIEGMKNEILSGPFDELKLAQVSICACYSLLDIFSCFAANLGPDKCAVAISMINEHNIKTENSSNHSSASEFKLICALLSGIANDSAVSEMVSGSDGVFQSIMQAKSDINLWFSSARCVRLGLQSVCTAVYHACAYLIKTISAQEMLSLVMAPNISNKVAYVDIQEMIKFEQIASKLKKKQSEADDKQTKLGRRKRRDSLGSEASFNSSSNDSNALDIDDIFAEERHDDHCEPETNHFLPQSSIGLVTTKVCTLLRYVLSTGSSGDASSRPGDRDRAFEPDSNKFYSNFLLANQSKYQTAGLSNDESLNNWSCIIFCRMKFSALTLCWLLSTILESLKQLVSEGLDVFYEKFPEFPRSSCWELLKPKFITGGCTQFDQVSTLLSFKCGEFNTLFATDVCEEGIHVRVCKLVINFDLPTTVKSYIQRRGRARAENSLMVAMLSDDKAGCVGFKDLASFAATECVMNERSQAASSVISQQSLIESFNAANGVKEESMKTGESEDDIIPTDSQSSTKTASEESAFTASSGPATESQKRQEGSSASSLEELTAKDADPIMLAVLEGMNRSQTEAVICDYAYTTPAGVCIENVDVMNYMHDYCSSLPKDKYYTPKEIYWITHAEPDEKIINYQSVADLMKAAAATVGGDRIESDGVHMNCDDDMFSQVVLDAEKQQQANESGILAIDGDSEAVARKVKRALNNIFFFRCSILLPPSVPLQIRCVVGPLCLGKIQAKYEAVMVCLINLHKVGQLDDFFRPKYPSTSKASSKPASITSIVSGTTVTRDGNSVNDAELVIESFKSTPEFKLIQLTKPTSIASSIQASLRPPTSPTPRQQYLMYFYKVDATPLLSNLDDRLYLKYSTHTDSYKRMISDLNSVAMGWVLRSLNSIVFMTTVQYDAEVIADHFSLFFRGNVELDVKIDFLCSRYVNHDIVTTISAFNKHILARQKVGIGEFLEKQAAASGMEDEEKAPEQYQRHKPAQQNLELDWCSLVPLDEDQPNPIVDTSEAADVQWLQYLQQCTTEAETLYFNLSEHRRRALTAEQNFDDNNGMKYWPVKDQADFGNMMFGSIFNPSQCYVGVPNSDQVPMLKLHDTFLVKNKPNKMAADAYVPVVVSKEVREGNSMEVCTETVDNSVMVDGDAGIGSTVERGTASVRSCDGSTCEVSAPTTSELPPLIKKARATAEQADASQILPKPRADHQHDCDMADGDRDPDDAAKAGTTEPITYVSRSYLNHYLMKEIVPAEGLLSLAAQPEHGLVSALSVSTNRAYIALLDRSTDDISKEIRSALDETYNPEMLSTCVEAPGQPTAEPCVGVQKLQQVSLAQDDGQQANAHSNAARMEEAESAEMKTVLQPPIDPRHDPSINCVSTFQISSKNLLSHLIPEYCKVIGHARWYYFAMACPSVIWRFHSLIHAFELRKFLIERNVDDSLDSPCVQTSAESNSTLELSSPTVVSELTMESQSPGLSLAESKLTEHGGVCTSATSVLTMADAVVVPRLPPSVHQPPLRALIEAVSPRLIHDICNYECMEWFGDIILKFAATCEVFYNNPEDHEGALTAKRCAYINNSNLITRARESFVYRFMRVFAMSDGNRTLFHLFPGKPAKPITALKPASKKDTTSARALPPSVLAAIEAAKAAAANPAASMPVPKDSASNSIVKSAEITGFNKATTDLTVDTRANRTNVSTSSTGDENHVRLSPFKLKAKLLADLIESLLGCYFLHGRPVV
jgi:ERCC4-related helicase/dsRNA-specific ribonuclease